MFACCELTSFPFSHHYARRPAQAAMLYVAFVFTATTPLVLPSLSRDSRVLVRALPSRRRSRSCSHSHSHSRLHSCLHSRLWSRLLPHSFSLPCPRTPVFSFGRSPRVGIHVPVRIRIRIRVCICVCIHVYGRGYYPTRSPFPVPGLPCSRSGAPLA